MLNFPQINPIAFSLGPVKVHWYGLMYLLAFSLAYLLAHLRRNRYKLPWSDLEISDLIFYCSLGIIIGGRVGYMIFYDFHNFIRAPWILFKLWDGGMSFHGGVIGVFLGALYFSKKFSKKLLAVGDFITPLVPLGLACGRIGNFINGELWGRPSSMPWAMIFPMSDGNPRHPSQLYEFLLEGIILFFIMWWYSSKKRPLGRISALFLICYAICRIIAEFFRQPDLQLGFIFANWVTMGMILSLPMLIIGLIIWFKKI